MFEPSKGASFWNAVKECWKHLRENDLSDTTMVFNDIHVRVSIDSNLDDLQIIYNLKHLLRQHNIKY